VDFDLMCEFQERMKEVKKGFNHFPKEWEFPFSKNETFPDFAGHASDETSSKKIISEYKIDKKNYTGFVRNYSKIDNNFVKFYTYLENGSLRYSQSELTSGKMNVKKTSFYDSPFEIVRTYIGSFGMGDVSKPVLGVVKRTGVFDLNGNFSTKVFQHSLDSFEIYFSVDGINELGFLINNKDKRNEKYLLLIRKYPFVFYDKEGIKDSFGDIFIRNGKKGKIKIETFLKQNGI